MEHSPDVCDLSGCATCFTNDDKDDDSFLAPSSQAANPVAADRTVPASASQDLDMQEMCKRMAAKLNIPWPAVQVETTKL